MDSVKHGRRIRILIPALLILMVAPLGEAVALECVSYGDYIHVASETALAGNGKQVRVRDGIAYVASGGGNLKILDLTDPESPVEISQVGDHWTQNVSLGGEYAYLSYSHSDATPPYIAGFQVADISDPASPTVLHTVETYPVDLGASVRVGSHLLVSATDGLRVYELSDTSTPVLAATVPDCDFLDMEVAGDIAFLSRGINGLKVLDISDPLAPLELASQPTSRISRGMSLDGTQLLVAESFRTGFNSQLRLIDVSDPAAPLDVAAHDLASSPLYDVVRSADIAIIGGSELRFVDIADPAAPVDLGELGLYQEPRSLALAGDALYAATHNEGPNPTTHYFTVVDLSNPSFAPTLNRELDQRVKAIATAGELAYLAAGNDGLAVMDLSDPALPQQLALLPLPGGAEAADLAVDGDHVYLVARNAGLFVVNVADPATPTLVANLTALGNVHQIALAGNHAYLGAAGAFLVTVDISVPSSPVRLASMFTGYSIADIAVVGDAVYLSRWDEGILIVDVSDPALPLVAMEFEYNGGHLYKKYLALSGDLLLYASDSGGWSDPPVSSLSIVDVSDPFTPTILSVLPLPGYAHGLAVSGSTAYAQAAGLHVIDFVDPHSPCVIGYLPEACPAALAAGEDMLLLSDYGNGLPERLALAPLECPDMTAVPEDELAAARLDRLSSQPNPFNPSTRISFDLPAAGQARLSIHALSGRLVKELVNARLAAGAHQAQWDGRNDQGRPQASGVYFLRLEAPGLMEREKLVLLK